MQPVAVGIVLFGALLAWILPCGWGAKDWFRGEKHNLEPSVGNSPHHPKRWSKDPLLQTCPSLMSVPTVRTEHCGKPLGC